MKLNTTTRKRFRVSNNVKKVASEGRFRLSISRSSRNISAQIIDDKKKITLVSASSIEKDLRLKKIKKIDKSNLIGEILAKRAKEKKITNVYFDRGEHKYHGRVKAFAETLRKNGLKF